MISQEYMRLVEIQETKCKLVKNKYGQSILVKEIPDLSYEGEYDPRVLSVREKETKEKTEFGYGTTLQEIRDNMGWPNQDVTDGTIRKENRIFEGINGEIPTEIYTPIPEKVRPCIIFFHGGGFFGGSLKCVENPCKVLAQNADSVVISVDYRLAPEEPFPKGLMDNLDVITYIYHHAKEFNIDQNKIGVCGDSAGANMAAVCTLRDRNQGSGMIHFEALLYPVVNVGGLANDEYLWNLDEYSINFHKDMITDSVTALGKNSNMLIDLYLEGDMEKARNPYVSPLFANNLTHMPNTLIINAEFDYLRLEGEAYGRKLEKEGNRVNMIRYNGTDHAFMDKIGEYPQAEDAMKEVAKHFLKAIE